MIIYKGRTLWQEIKEDIKILTPFALIAMILGCYISLTPMAFIGLCVAPALVIKTIIRWRRGDYKRGGIKNGKNKNTNNNNR